MNPIIKCNISFLTHFVAWNQFLNLKLQLYDSVTFKQKMKVKQSPAVIEKYNFLLVVQHLHVVVCH